jgi:hypothetical protein
VGVRQGDVNRGDVGRHPDDGVPGQHNGGFVLTMGNVVMLQVEIFGKLIEHTHVPPTNILGAPPTS